MPPGMTGHTGKHTRPSRRGTRDLIWHKTTISPNVGSGRHTLSNTIPVKLIKHISPKKQARGVRTHGAHKQIASTLSSRPSPKRGTMYTQREQRKPPVPQETTPKPMTLIHSHETMKLMILSQHNKRRMRTFSQKGAHFYQYYRRSDKELAAHAPQSEETQLHTPPTKILRRAVPYLSRT